MVGDVRRVTGTRYLFCLRVALLLIGILGDALEEFCLRALILSARFGVRALRYAMLTSVLPDGLITLCFSVQRQFNQLLNQQGIGQPGCFPKLGIHADICKSGYRIDLV